MVNFIACADIHLRDTIPICRTDDYIEQQWLKLNFLIETANEKNCDIFCAGDFFHKAKSSSYVIGQTVKILKKLKNNFFIIPGQHDLPHHNIQLLNHSSLYVLEQAGVINLISCDYQNMAEISSIGMIHTMIHKDKKIHDNIESRKAKKILQEHPSLNIIISGDNHEPFQEEIDGRYLINCGSMMRMTADQLYYIPGFYFVEGVNPVQKITRIQFPYNDDALDRSHIDTIKKRDDRINSFVENLSTSQYEVELNFEKNIDNFLEKNKIRKPVKKICQEIVHG